MDDLHADQRHASRCFMTITNSAQWIAVTGERPPIEPPTAKAYADVGLPWFDYYGGDAEAVAGAEKFKSLEGVAILLFDLERILQGERACLVMAVLQASCTSVLILTGADRAACFFFTIPALIAWFSVLIFFRQATGSWMHSSRLSAALIIQSSGSLRKSPPEQPRAHSKRQAF